MNSPLRLTTLGLLLLCTGYFPCQHLWATGNRAAAGPPIEPLTAQDSGLAQADKGTGLQSSADDADPLFPVEEHGKWSYIDKTGKIVITLQFYFAQGFHEGMAFVQLDYDPGSRVEELVPIDKTGKPIMGRLYSYGGPFAEGLALVEIPWSHGFVHIDKGGLGYIDKTGKMVIPLQQYGHASAFTEGLAAVEDHGKWGYIDKTGTMVISPQFSGAYGFSEGLAEVKDGKKWGYIDKTGKMVIPPQYDAAWKHSGGLAAVKAGGKWGYIDLTGNIVIPPRFDSAGTFSGGLAEVKYGNEWGYIDNTGKYVWGPTK